ncbi:uncharacterized protein LOC110676078 [Aedes aegypti]|uniref:Uncharacterized protein n=1 Tax=Aedes aegypti TaxID=7159 RepID=A0A6I8U7Z3_AEDAE|nr:uncharacterized protein LOC110676078 [Aedes aegypti]
MAAAGYAHFWTLVEREVGYVPKNIKFILNWTNYVNGALAELDDDQISLIEADMRKCLCGVSEELDECFHKFAYDPQKFHFLAGERAIMKLIAKTLKEKGMKHFFKKMDTQNIAETSNFSCEMAAAVPQKILEFYTKKVIKE